MDDQNEAAKKEMQDKLNNALAHLRTVLKTYDPEKYSIRILAANKENWIKKMEDAHSNVVKIMYEIEDICLTTDTEKDELTKTVDKLDSELINYITKINDKILESVPINVHVPAPPFVRAANVAADDRAAKAAEINSDIDADKISQEVKQLKLEINKQPDWSLAESHQIEVAMKSIAGWKTRFGKIKDTLYSLRRNVLVHELDDEQLLAAEAAVKVLESEMALAIENIEYEDTVRCLFTLATSKASNVSFPMFQGFEGEDFLKFQKEFLDAVKCNRIRKESHVPKLKECLKGTPRSIIPDSLEDIDEALGILKSMYGDPSRLVKARKSKLIAMGPLPKPKSKYPNHVKQQVEWLLAFELIMNDLFELANQNMDCFCEIYNTSMLKIVKGAFPYWIYQDFANYAGMAKEVLAKIYDYVIQLRQSTQKIMRDLDGGTIDTGQNAQVPVHNANQVTRIKMIGYEPDEPIAETDIEFLQLMLGEDFQLDQVTFVPDA